MKSEIFIIINTLTVFFGQFSQNIYQNYKEKHLYGNFDDIETQWFCMYLIYVNNYKSEEI